TMVEKDFTPYTTSPDPILKNLAGRQLPTLKGFVSTALKPGADLSVFVNSDGARAPIVASWKYGSGRAMAVTTDASGRWSGRWIENGVFAPLWDKLMAWLAPGTSNRGDYGVALGYRAGRIEIRLTDYSAGAGSADRALNAVVTAPNGAKFDAMLAPDGPGELAGSIEASEPGNYFIQLQPPRGSNLNYPPLAYTVSAAIDAELPRPAPNYGLLEQLASATGGRLNPAAGDLSVARPGFEHSQPVGPWLIIAAMLLLILEALIRRLTY
ncbi:hypothetical protein IMX07_13260, partial [bacterium]|nr:hypothetical protein [bacterium]